MATSLSLCASNLLGTSGKHLFLGLRPAIQLKASDPTLTRKSGMLLKRFIVLAVTKGSAKSSQSDERIPSWARPDSEEPPPWARNEGDGNTPQRTFEVPFYVYLLASAITAIAAVGSVFEFVNEKPVFGILKSDSVFYAPLLGFFALTGIPTSAFLWFKSVQAANKASEEQDRKDGFL